MMVFVVVSCAGKSRRFAIGLNMLACCSAQCFLTNYVDYRIEQLLFSYLFSSILCRPKREIKTAGWERSVYQIDAICLSSGRE